VIRRTGAQGAEPTAPARIARATRHERISGRCGTWRLLAGPIWTRISASARLIQLPCCRAAGWTSRSRNHFGSGFTNANSPTTTVGAVSLPQAAARTAAAPISPDIDPMRALPGPADPHSKSQAVSATGPPVDDRPTVVNTALLRGAAASRDHGQNCSGMLRAPIRPQRSQPAAARRRPSAGRRIANKALRPVVSGQTAGRTSVIVMPAVVLAGSYRWAFSV
jgi:hypothetical protein